MPHLMVTTVGSSGNPGRTRMSGKSSSLKMDKMGPGRAALPRITQPRPSLLGALSPPPLNIVSMLLCLTRQRSSPGLTCTHKRSRNGRHITDNKSHRPRVFSISPRPAERLGSFVIGRNPDEPLFLTAEGKRLHPDNFVQRKLKPLLKQLGLKGGLHAFRHGKATVQDRLNTPMKLRQERLGHAGSRTTMGYTHVVRDDDRQLVEQLDELLSPAEDRTILCRIVPNSNKKALAVDTQRLVIQ